MSFYGLIIISPVLVSKNRAVIFIIVCFILEAFRWIKLDWDLRCVFIIFDVEIFIRKRLCLCLPYFKFAQPIN